MADSTLYSAPSLVGDMRESPLYQTLGVGDTDRIFLLGHGNGVPLNDPFQVISIQDAVNRLGADSTSPLLRGFIEAYYGGARDMWLIAAAPMNEFVDPNADRLSPGTGRGDTAWADLAIPDIYTKVNALRDERNAAHLVAPTQSEWDAFNFYERYQARLDVAYEYITNWDLPQLLVPIEALFYGAGDVDFLTQIATHCADALELTGSIRMGFLGTRVDFNSIATPDAVNAMVHDARLAAQGQAGRFVSIIVGEGTVNLKEMPTMYAAPLTATAAGMLSRMPMNQGWIYKPLPNVLNVIGPDLSSEQANAMAEAKLNPAVRTTRGKRGAPFETVIVTDNTLGTTGTDFWSMGQVRLLMHVIEQIRAMSNRYIGTIEFGEYRRAVQNYLYAMTVDGVVRDFESNIVRDPTDSSRILVDVAVMPFFGLRQLSFSTVVGPGL